MKKYLFIAFLLIPTICFAGFQEKQLGQRRLSAQAESIYSPAAGVTAVVKSVVVSNVQGSAANLFLYLDDDGTTYDQSTAMMYDLVIASSTTVEVHTFWPMNNSSGNVAARSNASSYLTVTIFGAEIQE